LCLSDKKHAVQSGIAEISVADQARDKSFAATRRRERIELARTPQLQLQLANSSPAIRHLIFVGSLIFLLFNMLLLLVEGCHVQIGFR
jgi:hypothetical protein